MKRYIVTKITVIAACLAGSMMLSSCIGNFEDYNRHPYNPTPGELTPSARAGILFEKMFYQMHHNQENDSQMVDQMVGDQYGGYISTVNPWQGTNFSTYSQSQGWNQIPFNTPITNFYPNWNEIKSITEGVGHIYSWANIIRVAAMLRVTDTYGPIPYSKMGGGDLFVGYDSVEDVYTNMIDDLNAATTTLEAFWSEYSNEELAIGEYDIIYGGDFGKWIKFANSLKLRLAIRINGQAPELAKATAERAVAEGVITANSDNLMLPSVDNPYAKVANDWGEIRLSADLDSYMNGYGDPRITHYATYYLNNATYGVRGVRLGVNYSGSNSLTAYANYSKPKFDKESPLLVMNAAEVAFLRAEGVLNGWDMGGGTAQSYYEDGITLSMESYGIAGADISTYINDDTSVPANYTGPTGTSIAARGTITVKWDDAAGNDEKLERIITQKWIANFTLGFEAWSEFRRTGYPRLLPSFRNESNNEVSDERMVRRLVFPQSEYQDNAANVAAAVQMIGGQDLRSVDLWWAKKN